MALRSQPFESNQILTLLHYDLLCFQHCNVLSGHPADIRHRVPKYHAQKFLSTIEKIRWCWLKTTQFCPFLFFDDVLIISLNLQTAARSLFVTAI